MCINLQCGQISVYLLEVLFVTYLHQLFPFFIAQELANTAVILTNTKFSRFRGMATIVVADRTAVAPFIRLVCPGDCQCSTIAPPRRTQLPLLTPTALHSWLPFPLVAQGLCSCGLDGEYDRISWDNIILGHWLTRNFRRLS